MITYASPNTAAPRQAGILILMQGLPGSGKSTVAVQLQREIQAVIISPDAIRAEPAFGGDVTNQSNDAGVWDETYRRATEALRSGQGVIVDATHTWKPCIDRWRQIAADVNTLCVIHRVSTPLEECLQRNMQRERQVPESVIYRMAAQLAALDAEDGHG